MFLMIGGVHEVRNNPAIIGVKIPFDPNIIL